MIIKGSLIPKISIPPGLRAVAHLARSVEGETGQEIRWIDDRVTTPVDAAGEFIFELPDASYDSTFSVEIVSASGESLASVQTNLDQATQSGVEVPVELGDLPAIEPHPDPLLGRPGRIRGRLVSAGDLGQIGDRQVVLWARASGQDEATPLFTARTDRDGHFSGPYPAGEFEEAFGQVSISGATLDSPVHLQPDSTFEREILLVVTLPESSDDDDHDDCACHLPVPRNPDADDLANSSAYSVDLGGCVDFTVPNRTLEEFSFYQIVRTTEPELRGRAPLDELAISSSLRNRVLQASLRPDVDSPDAIPESKNAQTTREAEKTSRVQLAASTGDPIDPQTLGASTLLSLIDEVDALDITSLKRYLIEAGRAELFDAVEKLARQEGGRAELGNRNRIPWETRTTDFFQAASIAHGHLLHFKQMWNADGYSLGDLLYSLPLAPCEKKQIAVLDWKRRDIARREESLEAEDRLEAALERDRDVHEILDSTLAENSAGGSSASTWSGGGGFGFSYGSFVIGASGGAGGASSDAWQNSSRSLAGESLQQLRDRTSQAASSVRSQRSSVVQTVEQGETVRAETSVVANHNHCHAITMQYFEVLRHLKVLQELVAVQECLFVPLDMGRFTTAKTLRWRRSLERHLRLRELSQGFEALERIHNGYLGSQLPAGSYAEEQIEHLDGDLRLRFSIARPKDGEDGVLDETQWQIVAALTGRAPSYWFDRFLKGQSLKDRRFQELIAPSIAEAFVGSLRFVLHGHGGHQTPIVMDPTLVSKYRDGRSLLVKLRGGPTLTGLGSRLEIQGLEIETSHDLPEYSKVVVDRANLRYRTASRSDSLVRDYRVGNDLLVGDTVYLPTPPSRRELRNPRQEDQEKANRLLNHLNEHLEYYHRAIWWNMDAERRYMLLDGFEAPGAEGRSVASVVENRIIAIVGNSLVLPVAPGFHLDPTFEQDAENPVDLLHHYAPTSPTPPLRLSVPTRGVFAESVMGSCNSCEEKDETRFWRWEESPCPDQPTAIQPISTDSRNSDPGDLAPQGFAAPIINLQNAPAAPDPTGLGAALHLLGQGDAFRDLTGLSENQRNALASYQAALQTAKAFGSEAAALQAGKTAKQEAAKKDLGKTLATIEQARKKEMVPQKSAQRFSEAAFAEALGIEPAGGTGETKKMMKKALSNPAIRRWEFQSAGGDAGMATFDQQEHDFSELGDADDRYGGWDLQNGDKDADLRYGGTVRGQDENQAVPENSDTDGYVRRLQQDLITVGITLGGAADGKFLANTNLAVREFQIYAKSPNLATEEFAATPNPVVYGGPVSGVLNHETRGILDVWLESSLRCPVRIDAYRDEDIEEATGLPRAGAEPTNENLWQAREVRNKKLRMIARDVSGRYPMPPGRSADQIVVGYYGESKTKAYGGPNSLHDHNWSPEGEILPAALFYDPENPTPEQRSTFKVVRSTSESECRGYFDGVNAWDNVFVSIGPCHWTLGAKNWENGGNVAGFLAYFEEKQAEGWEKFTRELGIKPDIAWQQLRKITSSGSRQLLLNSSHRDHQSRFQWQTETGFEKVPLSAKEMDWFRHWHWYYRWKMAGRTNKAWQRCMYELATIRLLGVRDTPFKSGLGLPENTTIGDVFTSELGNALVLRWHARYPGHITNGGYATSRLEGVVRSAGLSSKPLEDWDDADEDNLIEALLDADGAPKTLPNQVNWGTGSGHSSFTFNPQTFDPEHPRLRRTRGSFLIDTEGHLPWGDAVGIEFEEDPEE